MLQVCASLGAGKRKDSSHQYEARRKGGTSRCGMDMDMYRQIQIHVSTVFCLTFIIPLIRMFALTACFDTQLFQCTMHCKEKM